MKSKLVVFSGAGMSAESGISTFRDHKGLWERYRIEEVATPEAWRQNPELVLDFYNQRRRQMWSCKPNKGHYLLAELELKWEVDIITQNIDNLHERAGSTRVLHLHGELDKARSTSPNEQLFTLNGKEIHVGDLCPQGFQLRPHVVWFGEDVPAMAEAYAIIEDADELLVIGTSLQVYPAAGLIHAVKKGIPCTLIDPADFSGQLPSYFDHIRDTAVNGIAHWKDKR